MMRPMTVYWLVLLSLAAGVLFHVSRDVDELEVELSGLNRQILVEHESIRVLRAEWAYLNRPDRLRRLAGTLTELEPLVPLQMAASASAIPMPLPEPGDTVSLADLTLPGFESLPLPPRAPSSGRTYEPAAPAPAAPTSVAVATTPPTPSADPTPTVATAAALSSPRPPSSPPEPASGAGAAPTSAEPARPAAPAPAAPPSVVVAATPPTPSADPTPTAATTAAFSSSPVRPARTTAYGTPTATAIRAANRSDDPIGALLVGAGAGARQWR